MDQTYLARLRLFSAIEPGNPHWVNIIGQFGPQETLELFTQNEMTAGAFNTRKIQQKLSRQSTDFLLDQLTRAQATFITPEEPDWPQQLSQLPASPIGLVIMGDRQHLRSTARSISIVGSRSPTEYGIRVAGDFAYSLSEHAWTIISGGAYGIDSCAHKAALAADGITIAILANGFNHNYPAGNETLFRDIAESGLLMSEVMPDVPAEPFRFLTRNRLIAALSQATIVVEAAYRSGSLRTAREAAEIFRQVLAVPGPITSPSSAGCHRLISERAAELVTSVAEIMELVNPLGTEWET